MTKIPYRPAANTTEIVALLFISVALGATGCGGSQPADKPDSPLKEGTVPVGGVDLSPESRSLEKDSPPFQQPAKPSTNATILKEVNDGGLWFHAKKTRPIWVRKLQQEETVKTLEGEEKVPAGNFLCRGEAGDIWPQNEERLTAKYTITDEADEQGWRKCIPKPDAAGVMAAQIPHAFQVQAKWGLLSGKPGDYVIKNYEDRAADIPEDVWIVDQGLFQATYERVAR